MHSASEEKSSNPENRMDNKKKQNMFQPIFAALSLIPLRNAAAKNIYLISYIRIHVID